MGEVYFYHLTRRSVADTLEALLPRCLSAGWRVAVRGTDPARLEALDARLWQGPVDGFLPHGMAGGDHDSLQPILLTTGAAANAADCVMAVDGAPLSAAEVPTLKRACILFDGLDGEAVSGARAQWSALTGAGLGARYWSEESGAWEEKASKNV